MNDRGNQILLTAFFITAVLYAFVMLCWVGAVSVTDPDLWMDLGLWFHAVPCFFLQLLICRAAKRPAIRLIPVLLLLGLAAWSTLGFFNAADWDGLGWGLLLLLCAAPAAGCALAWAVYGVQRLCRSVKR